MRNKKAKALRELVKKSFNINKLTVEYDTDLVERIVNTGRLNEDGSPMLLQSTTVVSTMVKDCPRSVYKEFKKFNKTLQAA